MRIRAAGSDDLQRVTTLRLRFLAEHRDIDPSELSPGFEAETMEFLRRHALAGTVRSWLASDDDGVDLGVVTMLVLDMAPRPEDRSNLEGHIINMYVDPSQRRRSIGRRLLDACVTGAEEVGLRGLTLRATDDGRPLYRSAGFLPRSDVMELRFAGPESSP